MPLFKKQQPPLERRRPVSSESRPRAFSYYANRSQQGENTGRLQVREQAISRSRTRDLLRYWLSHLGAVIAVLAILVCAVSVLSLSANPKIMPLTSSSSGRFLSDSSVYAEAASRILDSSFANHNKITINTGSIAKQLMREFPELSDVSVTLPLLGHRPIIYIEPTKPVFVLVASSHKAFVIDTNGRALIDTSRTSGLDKLNLPVITDQSGLIVHQGDIVLPREDVQFIKEVIGQLKARHIGVKSMTLPPVASELDVVPAGQKYKVKFNLHSQTARQQAGTFLAVRQKLKKDNVTPSKYVDVRVDGRAYYK